MEYPSLTQVARDTPMGNTPRTAQHSQFSLNDRCLIGCCPSSRRKSALKTCGMRCPLRMSERGAPTVWSYWGNLGARATTYRISAHIELNPGLTWTTQQDREKRASKLLALLWWGDLTDLELGLGFNPPITFGFLKSRHFSRQSATPSRLISPQAQTSQSYLSLLPSSNRISAAYPTLLAFSVISCLSPSVNPSRRSSRSLLLNRSHSLL